jgi:hypothetical protein
MSENTPGAIPKPGVACSSHAGDAIKSMIGFGLVDAGGGLDATVSDGSVALLFA